MGQINQVHRVRGKRLPSGYGRAVADGCLPSFSAEMEFQKSMNRLRGTRRCGGGVQIVRKSLGGDNY